MLYTLLRNRLYSIDRNIQFTDNVFENLKLYSRINIKYPVIETHPYPTKYYYEGDDFIKEISKESIEIFPTPEGIHK